MVRPMSAPSPALQAAATLDWGRTAYADAWRRQEELVARRNAGETGDTLVLTGNALYITRGRTRTDLKSADFADLARIVDACPNIDGMVGTSIADIPPTCRDFAGFRIMARHTAIDCHEKRGRRGYLFMIGDELGYPKVSRREVAKVIGGEPDEDVPIAGIVRELQAMYDVYFLIPEGGYHSGNRKLKDFWQGLLDQNVLYLDDPDAVCETIAKIAVAAPCSTAVPSPLTHQSSRLASPNTRMY